MNWKCLFGHDWKYISHRGIFLYECPKDSKPYKRFTRILNKCSRCGKFKCQEVDSDFSNVNEKDMGL